MSEKIRLDGRKSWQQNFFHNCSVSCTKFFTTLKMVFGVVCMTYYEARVGRRRERACRQSIRQSGSVRRPPPRMKCWVVSHSPPKLKVPILSVLTLFKVYD